jgi:hypothetical protein
MARTTQIPRSRGVLSGLLLVVLGAWGGLIPLVGPYATFGFAPDKSWDLTQGRLYLSVVPGAAVLLAGLVIMMTRSRGFGGFCAFVAALAGFWFIGGASIVRLLPASIGGSISIGAPLQSTLSQEITTELAFFWGTGALILLFASTALGRFSIAPAREHARVAEELATGGAVTGLAGAGVLGYDAYQAGQAVQSYSPAQPYSPVQSQFPAGQDTYGETQTAFGQPARSRGSRRRSGPAVVWSSTRRPPTPAVRPDTRQAPPNPT